ncbi:hypothetical protein PRZ48_009807 [Zasmidium cellare]|uniref:Uncharacterized protein n=1 Tax=Zasmidium cellare TaxID=395010 RepID=A0ABR0ECR3_ZASCE|nr:hypothetical protein PRZ48_009807 [Zasmidium cellare]
MGVSEARRNGALVRSLATFGHTFTRQTIFLYKFNGQGCSKWTLPTVPTREILRDWK